METPLERIKEEAKYQASIQNDVYDQSIELGYTLGGVTAHNKAIEDAIQAVITYNTSHEASIIDDLLKLKIPL
jgi:hypothetical protein